MTQTNSMATLLRVEIRLRLAMIQSNMKKTFNPGVMRLFLFVTLLITTTFINGCILFGEIPKAREESIPVYILSNGWHCVIIVPGNLKKYPFEAIQDLEYIWRKIVPQTWYYEIGWGDRIYHQHPDPNLYLGVRALFWPTDAAIHIAGFNHELDAYANVTIVRIDMPSDAFAQLIKFINGEFALKEDQPIRLGDPLHGTGGFFLSKRSYHLPLTSNAWVAMALKRSGYPITPYYHQTANTLIDRVKEFGTTIQSSKSR